MSRKMSMDKDTASIAGPGYGYGHGPGCGGARCEHAGARRDVGRWGWAGTLGCYLAGLASVLSLGVLVLRDVVVSTPVQQLLAVGIVIAMVTAGIRLPSRWRLAFWLGAGTAVVLAAAAIGWFIWAFAHSSWQF